MDFQATLGRGSFKEAQDLGLVSGKEYQKLERFFQVYRAKVCFMLSEGVSYWYIINPMQLNQPILDDIMDEQHPLTSQIEYNPDKLLDALLDRLVLKNDAALARALEVAPPVISKIRHRRLPVGASILIRMHEVSNLSIRELRDLMGDRRQKYRLSDVQGKPKQQA
jgi:hypothetical protein